MSGPGADRRQLGPAGSDSFLGPGTRFEGKISFSGSVSIDGQFEGDIRADGTLVVGETGVLHADVDVRRLVVRGSVEGDIHAKERVEVASTGRVDGRLSTPALQIEEGALVEARVEMGESKR